MLFYPRSYFFINPARRSFWWGVGTAGLAWAFRRQLRPLAVQGAKGLLFVAEGVKGVFSDTSEELKDVVVEAKTNVMKKKIKSLDLSNEDLGFIKQEVSKLSQQLEILNKVMTEQMTKEKEEDVSM